MIRGYGINMALSVSHYAPNHSKPQITIKPHCDTSPISQTTGHSVTDSDHTDIPSCYHLKYEFESGHIWLG